ncbi:hypothetical protein HPSMNH_0564 [Glaesserella parasuis MN-H]|uniref:Uncharacterized protein n=2 Tax=Pasteurellaceae TaxID=712 RepID=A0A6B9L5H2_GLAPU|nr:hypothetical protein HPSMNH_0564 [Glaesserella parasuis MN-H]QHB36520.1 hypothetical protein [Glaesserella parasuis]QRX38478.1 hypothetical protein [Actinobacillus sp.]QOW02339.1 hypothetical protein [Glaesserella parasuis]QOW02432.1 hypothetical protein [Glaesserella parasuis]
MINSSQLKSNLIQTLKFFKYRYVEKKGLENYFNLRLSK